MGCGLELVDSEAFRLFQALAFAKSPRFQRLHHRSHLVEVVDVENHVDAVGAVLNHSGARQLREFLGDPSPVVGTGPQVFAAIRVKVAVATWNYRQPRIMEPAAAAAAAFGLIALLTGNLVAVAEARFEIDAVCQSGPPSVWCSR
jgi:hypothetical protein